jgi:predicted nuclease with RNAse H fold
MNNVVVGIDVGGPKKGFHTVALCDGRYLERFATPRFDEAVSWCDRIGARIVAVDAPSRWRTSDCARDAERKLLAAGIRCILTPKREQAERHPFYQWMLQGELLYEALASRYVPFSGRLTQRGKICLETFPHGIACALAERVVSAKEKRRIRREFLQRAGVAIEALTNIDYVDAALCALTADYFGRGRCTAYGKVEGGFIVLPSGLQDAQGI